MLQNTNNEFQTCLMKMSSPITKDIIIKNINTINFLFKKDLLYYLESLYSNQINSYYKNTLLKEEIEKLNTLNNTISFYNIRTELDKILILLKKHCTTPFITLIDYYISRDQLLENDIRKDTILNNTLTQYINYNSLTLDIDTLSPKYTSGTKSGYGFYFYNNFNFGKFRYLYTRVYNYGTANITKVLVQLRHTNRVGELFYEKNFEFSTPIAPSTSKYILLDLGNFDYNFQNTSIENKYIQLILRFDNKASLYYNSASTYPNSYNASCNYFDNGNLDSEYTGTLGSTSDYLGKQFYILYSDNITELIYNLDFLKDKDNYGNLKNLINNIIDILKNSNQLLLNLSSNSSASTFDASFDASFS